MELYKLDDVYGISREVPLNYVERDNVDKKLRNSLNRKRHITIFGSSKQGKTCLRKHCINKERYIIIQCNNKWSISELNANILKRAGYELEESSKVSIGGKTKVLASLGATIHGLFNAKAEGSVENEVTKETVRKQLELDITDVNDIISALDNIGFDKYIVLEDFHYLRPEIQKDFSIELKAFHENSDLCFIIVGVWLDENRLVVYNGDLTGRIISINADLWTNDELIQVIHSGERYLNIKFTDNFTNGVIKNCSGNVYIVQEACHRICEENSIFETQEKIKELGTLDDAIRITKDIVKDQSARYKSFLSSYSAGFQDTSLEMHKWVLYAIFQVDKEMLVKGVPYRKIKEILQVHHPRKSDLNAGNITQALKSVASLQVSKSIQPIIMDYDETNSRLQIVDRGFIIWLENQDYDELISSIDLPQGI